MRHWVIGLGLVALAACGTSRSPEQLRDDVPPEVVSSLRNFKELYVFLDDRIRACHGSEGEIKSALYAERGRGAVAVHKDGTYSLLVEILESPEGYGSQITVHSRDETLGERVQGWLQGEAGC